MSSITCRIATGKHAGRKVAALQTLPGDAGPLEGDAGQSGGPSTLLRTDFSLHAGVAAEAHESRTPVPLRPAVSQKRLSLSQQGTALPAQDALAQWHHARLFQGRGYGVSRGFVGSSAMGRDMAAPACPGRGLLPAG